MPVLDQMLGRGERRRPVVDADDVGARDPRDGAVDEDEVDAHVGDLRPDGGVASGRGRDDPADALVHQHLDAAALELRVLLGGGEEHAEVTCARAARTT